MKATGYTSIAAVVCITLNLALPPMLTGLLYELGYGGGDLRLMLLLIVALGLMSIVLTVTTLVLYLKDKFK